MSVDFDVEVEDVRLICRFILLRRRFVAIQAELDNVCELIRQRNISFGEFK